MRVLRHIAGAAAVGFFIAFIFTGMTSTLVASIGAGVAWIALHEQEDGDDF